LESLPIASRVKKDDRNISKLTVSIGVKKFEKNILLFDSPRNKISKLYVFILLIIELFNVTFEVPFTIKKY
jgi:hypothetical protein